ncbi:MAG: argininosuccinate synthase [Planctomycetota bacterium]|jgi:argininosuccinate synthase
MSKPTVALAYSGGLDTSYCILELRERGYDVLAATVDTGGFQAGELEAIGTKALELGALEHVVLEATGAVFDRFATYLIKGNVLRGNVYPLCVAAERVQQAIEIAEFARARGCKAVAHGSTGAGNDQLRFDAAIRTLLQDVEILAPIREKNVARATSAGKLREAGFPVEEKTEQYSINDSLWGTTIGGRETHDPWLNPPEEVYRLTRSVETAEAPIEVVIHFEQGIPTSIDGEALGGPALIARLNDVAGLRGVGRGIHCGDTILGIKGRIAFEAPGPIVLVAAHRELEKLVLTKWQQSWKDNLGAFYGNFVHEGQYFEPVLRDIEAFLDSSQAKVTGEVRVWLGHGHLRVLGARSDHSLFSHGIARYGEDNAFWDGRDARGFAKLFALQPAMAVWRDERIQTQTKDA